MKRKWENKTVLKINKSSYLWLFLLPSEDMGKVKNKPQNFKDEKSAIWQILHDTLLFSNCMYVLRTSDKNDP